MTREAQQTAPFVLVLLRLGMLECKQDPSPDSSCVLGLLETRGEGLPIVLAKVGMARDGSDNKHIIGHALAVQQHSLHEPGYRPPTPLLAGPAHCDIRRTGCEWVWQYRRATIRL